MNFRGAWMGVAMAVGLSAGCTAGAPKVSTPYEEDFAEDLGSEWNATGGTWKAMGGGLYSDGADNAPLWLSLSLPDDVRISFDAMSRSSAVDIKFEVFGDGKNHASGYVVILGGWNNSKSIIARKDEHGPVRLAAEDKKIRDAFNADPEKAAEDYANHNDIVQKAVGGTKDHVHKIRLERKDNIMRFFVDNAMLLEYFDPAPLKGDGNDRFAFNNWKSVVTFDNLDIQKMR